MPVKSPANPTGETKGKHRGDIDGLRAVAVTVVVLFHARIPGFEAGFVGVDVFFVISGFLITGLLVDEAKRTGRISLRSFWARRLRRLSPALTVMVIATLIATIVFYSPLRWGEVARDATLSSVYASNVAFALDSVDYFGGLDSPSPLLHTWSLSVEEQFYILWPSVVAAVAWFCRRRAKGTTAVLGWVIPIACLTSFVVCFILTRRGTPWAYYSLPTRWWEIGLGSGTAVWIRSRSFTSPRITYLALFGAVGILAALVLIGPTTPFPGVAAALPATSTVFLLIGGLGGGQVSRALAATPLQWIGRRSYSWYLWHWPVLTFVESLRQGETMASRLLWAAASFVPAAIAFRFVEQPIRLEARWSQSNNRVLLLGASCVVAVLAISGGLVLAERHEMQDPFLSTLQQAIDTRVADIGHECEVGGESCSGTGPVVMLIGDSHAAHWLPAVRSAADSLGAQLVVRTRGGCPPWRLAVAVAGTDQPSQPCLDFKAETDLLVENLQPDLVVIASGNYEGGMLREPGDLHTTEEEGPAWSTAASDYLAWLKPQTDSVGLILDNPYVPFDPLECLGKSRDPGACRFEQSELPSSLIRDRNGELHAATTVGIASTFDPLPLICHPTCDTWAYGRPIFADRGHLTAEFTRNQSDKLIQWISSILDQS